MMKEADTTELVALVQAMQTPGLQVVLPDHYSNRSQDLEILVPRVAGGELNLTVTHDSEHHRTTFRVSECTPTAPYTGDCKRRARPRPTIKGMRFSVGVEKGRVWACCVAKGSVCIDDALRILISLIEVTRDWNDDLGPRSCLSDSMFQDLMDLAIDRAREPRRGRQTPHPICPEAAPPREPVVVPCGGCWRW